MVTSAALKGPVAPKVQLVAINALKPSWRNARTHSKKQIRQIANSLASFGWTYPILTDESHNIIAGHGRLEAAKLLQFQQVPVIEMIGLNEAQKHGRKTNDPVLSLLLLLP